MPWGGRLAGRLAGLQRERAAGQAAGRSGRRGRAAVHQRAGCPDKGLWAAAYSGTRLVGSGIVRVHCERRPGAPAVCGLVGGGAASRWRRRWLRRRIALSQARGGAADSATAARAMRAGGGGESADAAKGLSLHHSSPHSQQSINTLSYLSHSIACIHAFTSDGRNSGGTRHHMQSASCSLRSQPGSNTSAQ